MGGGPGRRRGSARGGAAMRRELRPPGAIRRPGGRIPAPWRLIIGMEQEPATAAVDRRIADLAARQHGVVGARQLLALGLGRGAIEHRVRAGRLHRLHRGVYAVGHPRIASKGRYMAAVLACGPDAVLSHVSAADLWELLDSSASSVHVTVPSGGGRGRREAIVLHRSRGLSEDEVTVHDGFPITSVARTLLDLAATIAPGPLKRAVERSLIVRRFDLRAVRAVLARHANSRCTRSLSEIVANLHDEPSLTRSELEGFFRDLCDEHSLPRPQINQVVEGLTVDFLWSDHRLIVETDGRAVHGTPAAFERDRARDAKLMVAGYRVVRFTYRQIVHEPETVARTLLALLAAPLAA